MKRALVTGLAVLCVAGAASAQISGGGGRGGGSGKNDHAADLPPPLPEIKGQPDPRQRLDPGALLCATEAQLRQHQQAVAARLGGSFAPEPKGCRIVRATVAVSVVGRDGPAATEVNLPGATPPVGWTDSRLREASGSH